MNVTHCAEIIISLLVGSFLSNFVLPRISLVAFKKRLFDSVNCRKIHTAHIPRLGGLAFFPCITVTILSLILWHNFWEKSNLLGNSQSIQLASIVCGLFMVYLMGMMDDLIGVRYRSKFIVQIICSFILIGSHLYIDTLGGLFGITSLPLYISLPFTILLIVYILNAINLIDGIDGLASGLSIIAFLAFGTIFIKLSWWLYAYMSFAALGVLLPFFYYNVFGKSKRGRKLFMGDTGSLTIGMLLAVMAIKLSKADLDKDVLLPNAIVLAFSFLIVPLLDVVRVVLHRIREKKSPFLPDKNHIHHKFIALGMTQRQAMISIVSISLLYAFFNIIMIHYCNITLLFSLDILTWTIMHCIITYKINKLIRMNKLNKIIK